MSAEAVPIKASVPPILCQRKIVVNTLQILLREFLTYGKITAAESLHFCAAGSVVV